MTYKASIILSAYDQAHALELVLAGLTTQSEKTFEVLLAEDDEDPHTAALVKHYSGRLNIRHFHQPHRGFRKCRILNQAIRAATGEVLIFLDGDCIPHSEYVWEHIALQESGVYVAGRRVDLSEEVSQELTPERIADGILNGSFGFLCRLWWDGLKTSGSTPFHRAYMVRLPWLRRLTGLERVVDMKGCNFSVLRQHMLAINGFDESYEGYGREDTDVELRLQHLGLRIKSAKNLCLQFHVWHERRGFTPVNETLLQEVQATKRVRALKGLDHA